MTDSPFLTGSFLHRLAGAQAAAARHPDAPERRRESEDALLAALALDLLDRVRAGRPVAPEVTGFFAYCLPRVGRAHAQILQDLWVLFMLGEGPGTFIEFGACDGLLLSNTLLLEREHGWTGLLAEPNPRFHAALAQNRDAAISHLCVAARGGETVRFLDTYEKPELSRMEAVVPADVHERAGARAAAHAHDVPTATLHEMLAAHDMPPLIDYLSIDTEGSEADILEAHDFDRHRFRLVTVEHAGEEAKRARILARLEGAGYRRWHPELSRWDDWYVSTRDVPGAGG